MRPRKRVAVLEEDEVSLGMRCFAAELWGHRVFPARTAAELERVLENAQIDVVLAVLPRAAHGPALELAQGLGAAVLTLDVKANPAGGQANVSLAMAAAPAEIRAALRVLSYRKRGPKNPGTARWQELQIARAS